MLSIPNNVLYKKIIKCFPENDDSIGFTSTNLEKNNYTLLKYELIQAFFATRARVGHTICEGDI